MQREKIAIEGLYAVLIRLALPNRAPAVELIIGQPQYDQPSMTSPPHITQRGPLEEDTHVNGWHAQPAHPTC